MVKSFPKSLKARISLIITLIIISFLIISIPTISKESNILTENRIMEKISNLSKNMTFTFHELQSERGISIVYLTSKEKMFNEQLANQRKLSDKYVKNIYKDLNILKKLVDKTSYPYKGDLYGYIGIINDKIDRLKDVREKISKYNITTKSTIDFYYSLEDILINVILQLNTLIPTSKVVQKTIISYISFMHILEYIGIERDIVTSIITEQKTPNYSFKDLIKIKGKKDAYIELLTNNNSEILLKIKDINSLDGTLKINRYINKIINNDIKGITVQAWFRLMTNYINSLRNIEIKLLNNIVNSYQNDIKESIKSLLVVSLKIALFIICSLLLIYITRSLTKPLFKITEVINQLANGNITVDIPKVSNINELNDITKATKIFKKNIEKLDKSLHNLNEAKKKAELADKTKTDFLSNMSHEIRTPVNGIIGVSELLSESIKDKENIKMLSIIINSAKHLIYIINDILDISKIESGKIKLELRASSLEEPIKEVIYTLSASAEKRGNTINYEISPDVPKYFRFDTFRLKQILTNIIGNAIKFTENGNIDISVKINQQYGDRYSLVFAIKDNGIGIKVKDKDMLFKKFSQANTSTTRKYGGTGLGLNICKEICKIMEGIIWFEKNKDKGTTFFFTVILEKIDKIENKANISNSNNSNNKSTSDINILIVEDIDTNIFVISGILKKLGHSHDITNNGQEALEALEKKHYDLVLMDCQMPVMDGFEATKQIIKKYGKDRPKVVALTASVMNKDKERCLSSGMDDIICKPINKSDVSNVIEELLINKKAA